jgi:hypothetical protein
MAPPLNLMDISIYLNSEYLEKEDPTANSKRDKTKADSFDDSSLYQYDHSSSSHPLSPEDSWKSANATTFLRDFQPSGGTPFSENEGMLRSELIDGDKSQTKYDNDMVL